MWNPKDPTHHLARHELHRFTAVQSDCGFTKFFELQKLFTSSEGQSRSLIENNSINITVFVKVFKDPTGDLWVDNTPKVKSIDFTHEICKTKDGFIFSFKNKNNFKDPILSQIKNIDEALIYCSIFAPAFSRYEEKMEDEKNKFSV